jgi:hypothetical protein
MVKAGDSVVCHIRDNVVASIYETNWQDETVFDIVCTYAEGYMIYIPVVMCIKDCIYITKDNHARYNADKRFVDSSVLYITDYNIIRTHNKIDGMRCSICDEFYGMAEANTEGGNLICWCCKNYRQWKSSPE